MDLRAFTVRLSERLLDITTVHGLGTSEHTLAGPAFARLEPLLLALWAHLPGDSLLLTVDGFARTLARDDHPASQADYLALIEHLAPLARALRAELYVRTPDRPDLTPSDPNFWDPLFAANSGGWELGRPAPPLAAWFSEHVPKGKRVLVVGCGRGHEARLLAGLGARVTALDFAPSAIAQAIAATDPALAIDFQLRDLFTLPRVPTFDLAVEHTCFCAIDPARRDEYVDLLADILLPAGELIALFYAHGRPGGPPFSVDVDELTRRFTPRFEILALAPARDSTLIRHGDELFARLRRRPP